MSIDEWRERLIAGVLIITLAGALLGISVDWLLTQYIEWMTSALVGLVFGLFATAIAKALTEPLPKALLFGGSTMAVVTLVVRLWLELQT